MTRGYSLHDKRLHNQSWQEANSAVLNIPIIPIGVDVEKVVLRATGAVLAVSSSQSDCYGAERRQP